MVELHDGRFLVLPHASKVKLVWGQRMLARPLRKLGMPIKLKKHRFNRVVAAYPPEWVDKPVAEALAA
ncbi:MAG: hypothetical protein WAX89_06340 [Alphaproteobacteria bacterium]